MSTKKDTTTLCPNGHHVHQVTALPGGHVQWCGVCGALDIGEGGEFLVPYRTNPDAIEALSRPTIGARFEELVTRGQKMIERGASACCLRELDDGPAKGNESYLISLGYESSRSDGEPFADLAVLVAWIAAETEPAASKPGLEIGGVP